jgi:hypothetical protein
MNTEVQSPISLADHCTTIVTVKLLASFETESVTKCILKYSNVNSAALNAAISALNKLGTDPYFR